MPLGLLKFSKLYSSLVYSTFFWALSNQSKSSWVLSPGSILYRAFLQARAFEPGWVPVPALVSNKSSNHENPSLRISTLRTKSTPAGIDWKFQFLLLAPFFLNPNLFQLIGCQCDQLCAKILNFGSFLRPCALLLQTAISVTICGNLAPFGQFFESLGYFFLWI